MRRYTHFATTQPSDATPGGLASANTMVLKRTIVALLAALAIVTGLVATVGSADVGGADRGATASNGEATSDDVAFRGTFGATWS